MSLLGNEILYVQGVAQNGQPAASTFPTTTAQIAALANTETTGIVTTPITTVGNGTLTAASLIGGQVLRTGPVAAFTDTTDTAVNIVAALPSFVANQTFIIRIKNATAFTQTIAAGAGVTLPVTVIIPAFSVGEYYATVTSATAVTLTHLITAPIATGTSLTALAITALSTVGAGVITAANFTGGYTARSGSQSGTPFTDTTDTAAAIIAANAAIVNKIGTSFIYVYGNATNAIATITGGTGVTVSGVTVIPAGMVAQFLVTYTAAATLTMVGIGVTNTVAGIMAMTGSTSGQTFIQPTAIASGTLTLPAVTGVIASTTGTNLYLPDLKRCTAQVDATSTTLANVTGLSFTVVPGTYVIDGSIDTTCGGTGGVKLTFNYTTAVLSAINANGFAYTAAAVAVSKTTTTTTQTSIVASNTAFTNVILKGTLVVSTGGTIDLQFAENSANSTSSVLVGSTLQLTRIA